MDINELIESNIKNIDFDAVIEHEIRRMIGPEVQKKIAAMVSEKGQSMIEEAIANELDNEIKTNDGWGKKAVYENLDALIKKTVKSKMDQAWDMKREVTKQVESRVKAMVNAKMADVTQKMVDELTETKLVKK